MPQGDGGNSQVAAGQRMRANTDVLDLLFVSSIRRYQWAVKWGTEIVSVEWLRASVQAGRPLPLPSGASDPHGVVQQPSESALA
jgi:hypothetical protein